MGSLARLGREPRSLRGVRPRGSSVGDHGQRARASRAHSECAHLDPVGRAGRAPLEGPYSPAQTWERRHELLLAVPLFVVRNGGYARAAARLGKMPREVKKWAALARWACARGTAVDGSAVVVPVPARSSIIDAKVRELLARLVDQVHGERGAA